MSERFVITVEAQPHSVPAVIRIRRLLKLLLRVCRLRCVSIERAGPSADG